MRRRYHIYDPEPHGTVELVRYFIDDMPDTRRIYGRAMMRRIAAGCPRCVSADRDRDRLRRVHTAYRRRA